MKNKVGGRKKNKFELAVKATPQIAEAYNKGLKALGAYSSKVKLSSPSDCEGSVDIDKSLKKLYAHDNRWDYCFSYKGETYFLEVHSANTSEVKAVLKKLEWLIGWLKKEAPQINGLVAKSRHPFYWVQSNGFHIPANSPQYRQAIQGKIKPISKLEL